MTDMEFIQFEPSAAVWPEALIGKSIITTMFYEGAVLRGADGRRFMLEHSEKGECVPKDVQSRLIFKEKFLPRQVIGVMLGAAALVLLNL